MNIKLPEHTNWSRRAHCARSHSSLIFQQLQRDAVQRGEKVSKRKKKTTCVIFNVEKKRIMHVNIFEN